MTPTALMLWIVAALLSLQDAPPTLGHANGVKIGEVTQASVVLWTRLTRRTEADHRVPEWDPAQPHWRVPGANGDLRFVLKKGDETIRATAWAEVDASSDFCHQVRVTGLEPDTAYTFEAQGRSGESQSRYDGSFTTAPEPSADRAVDFVVSTCQEFIRRDDLENGHVIYRSMLALEPDFFVQTGDTLYYDKPKPFAKDAATARYKWNRLYALPNLRALHTVVPTYWMHDDHDLLKDDCWPGQSYGELTWAQGLAIWREQIPVSDKPYRTFRWGRHLQIWLPEGRELRSPNTDPDGPEKSILGPEQWRWLEASLRESDATFKVYLSATPVVGPDRKGKRDNHANANFHFEGQRLRALLESIPGCMVINGDRHWQYESIDPETGLRELGCGPASDAHAGGFRMELREEWQPFLRIAGGFLSGHVTAEEITLRHHDVSGAVVHEVTIPAPR